MALVAGLPQWVAAWRPVQDAEIVYTKRYTGFTLKVG